ncbi:gamma-glutamyltranspeptidase-domain-containing protein [Phakopsora pachyrhizi]|uniref:Glutathione hydrolase n=1 Tax=Phakopsora pachyrhizi TaxID=170000 RepID=A0AAV0BR32_PHAPC|nr:gamma-glutamyltranspeptidase-domain-containing protein [Phakopsora pachyrhizi]
MQSSSKSTAIPSSSSSPHPFTPSPSSISFVVLQQIIKAQPTLLTFLISNNGSHSAINPNQAYKLFPHAAADLASRLDSTPTPLSPRIASVVTAASLAIRLSLQLSALVIQLIFETLRYLSTASLGISQRAIVSAVGGARAIHLSSAASPPTELDSLNSSYLDLLDCYTNLGIYVVHHLFTLAELFTLAGFNLTHTAVSTSFYTGIQIFYSGRIAQQLVETLNGDGGDVSIKDFSEYWPIVKRALKSNYLNQTFYTTHAPSSGPLLIYLLNILKNYQMTETNQSPLSEHWFLKALKYTTAACTILGDPNFLDRTEILQFKKFTSKSFANQVFKKIDDKLHTTQRSPLQDQKFIETVHRVVLSNETVNLDGFSHSKPGSGKYLGASLGLSARAVAGKTQHLQPVTDARKALSSFGSLGLPQLSTLQMQKARSSSPSLNPGRIGMPFEQTSLTGSRNAMKPSLSSQMEESRPAQLFFMPNLNSLSPPTIGLERHPAFHCCHILSVQQFTWHDLHALFSVSQEMRTQVERSGVLDILKGKVMCSMFYEPLTQTSASFEAAMNQLGGRVVSVLANKSSVTKGEKQISFFSPFLIPKHNIPYLTVLI